MVITLEHRLIKLDTAHNVRHIGGYATSDGRRTRSDIVRAGSLHRVTPEGARALAALGVTTIYDLRSGVERESAVTPSMEEHGIRHLWGPVFNADASPTRVDDSFPGFQVMYRDMLQNGQVAYRGLFEQLALSSGGFLFHCAAGKDRTGVAAALLLELAGVHDLEIVEDYSHSAGLLGEMLRNWNPPANRPRPSEETMKRLFASDAEDMVATLEYIRGCWGSSRGYMAAIGMPEDLIVRLRARLVE